MTMVMLVAVLTTVLVLGTEEQLLLNLLESITIVSLATLEVIITISITLKTHYGMAMVA